MRISGSIQRTILGAVAGAALLWLPVTLFGAPEAPGTAAPAAPTPAGVGAAAPGTPWASAAGVASGAKATSRATYVGDAACKACHKDAFTNWATSAHGKALSQDSLPAEHRGCEACHGPASEHAGSGGKTAIHVPKATDGKAADAACLACHAQSESSTAPKEWQTVSATHFTRTMHARKGLACVSCHTGHANGNERQLVKETPDLCLQCHAKVLESAPGKKAAFTHSPVAEGMCLTCHAPHGSADRNSVIADVQKACLECHDVEDAAVVTAHKGFPIADSKCAQCHDPHSHNKAAKLVRTKPHAPFKQGKCETCHTKPVAAKPAGLIKPAKELCMSCHPAASITPDGQHAHAPAKEGMCLTCHDPHVSNRASLMKTRPAYACLACHKKVETETVAEHRHKVFEDNFNCMMCHKPHSSTEKNLMVKDEAALCGQCHKHSFSHPIGKTADGKIVLNPMDGNPLVCSSCHEMHGSSHAALTIADKGRDLCVKCHTGLEH